MFGAALWTREESPCRLGAEERLLYGLRPGARPLTPMSPLWPCRQQQQQAAARLCMLEGMLFDSEDVFVEQARVRVYTPVCTCMHIYARTPSWSRLAARASLT